MHLLNRHAAPASYTLFGLHIASELALPELAQIDQEASKADITIRLGEVPEKLANPTREALLFSMTQDEYLLSIPQCCRYWIRAGREIICSPESDCAHPDLLVYLYGTCMAAIAYQRRLMPFHASVVERDGGAWLFAGKSGAGKSTLAAALQEKGYAVWSDDLCLLDVNTLHVAPGVPRIKLWQNSIEHFGWEERPKEPVIMRQEKFQFGTPASPTDWLPLRGIFAIDTLHNETISLQALQGVSALKVLEQNLFRPIIIHGLNAYADYFGRCMQLASKLPIRYIQRPHRLSTMPQVVEMLDKVLQA